MLAMKTVSYYNILHKFCIIPSITELFCNIRQNYKIITRIYFICIYISLVPKLNTDFITFSYRSACHIDVSSKSKARSE